MAYLSEMDEHNGLIGTASSKGAELAAQYKAGTPFPHIVIDEFLPSGILEECLSSFPEKIGELDRSFNTDQEVKSQYNPDTLPPKIRQLFYSFNSRPFLRIMENITQIKGLIPDPYFLGAGFHELRQGGLLAVHADFNHHKPLNLERRINVLIYLNKNWSSEFGGQIELWDDRMTKAYHSIVPEFNRCVIFSTTSDSYHGNPQPINHPRGVSRKSIALYYYTSTWSDEKSDHTTKFQVRPGTGDKKVQRSLANNIRDIAKDWIPPAVARRMASKRQSTS